MASIKLASAVGQQREPIGILGGLDDAINKTGDAFQAQQTERAKAAAKKSEQDQKYKDFVAANLKPRSLEGVRTEDWEEDQAFQKEGIADILLSSKDSNVTKAQLEQKQKDFIEGLQKREHLYKRDYKVIGSVAKKYKTHDTSLFDNFLIGITNPNQVSDMPNDDFMAASEANRAGTMPQENMPQYGNGEAASTNRMTLTPNGEKVSVERFNENPSGGVDKMNEMKRTETQTNYQGKPYFSQSIDERLKTDIIAKENELTALKQPEITKAAQGYFGKDFKFDSYTKRTDKVSPTTGEYVFEFDEKQADLDAKRFASSMIGEGSFGDKNHAQMQRALEYEALRAGNEAGFSGDKLAAFVEEVVPQMAYDKFMADAKAAEAARMKNDKDVTKQPSKGIVFNNTIGGGGENKQWRISSPITVPVREGATEIVTKDKAGDEVRTPNKKGELVDYDFYSIETVATGENPKKINFGGRTDVQLNGVYKDKKTGEIKYVKLSKNDKVFLEPIKKQSDLKGLKNNIGEADFDKFLGLGEYKNSEAAKENKAAAPKAKKIVKTGTTKDGKKVVKYDDGTIEIK